MTLPPCPLSVRTAVTLARGIQMSPAPWREISIPSVNSVILATARSLSPPTVILFCQLGAKVVPVRPGWVPEPLKAEVPGFPGVKVEAFVEGGSVVELPEVQP